MECKSAYKPKSRAGGNMATFSIPRTAGQLGAGSPSLSHNRGLIFWAR